MKKLLIGVGVQLGSSAVAIIVAALLLPRFSLGIGGFLTAVVIFTIAQSLLAGAVARLASKHVPAFAGLASLVSTLLALIIANLPFGGIRIHGFVTWLLAALIVWVITGLCATLAPKYLLKNAGS
ncbi:4 TMS phage holin, superfamily IV [Arthrobacter alpinus]|uniref:4 TMS phage holin, superfamily IV n=1 Tax=Arthrobacter alpinus TaxID=656366 RepID=A0A1H5MVX6_9MICC|nr:phage holin family protein [Arthrobacter alpinus]SEE93443.1 4 TMS phage holin, superfamily IV [Arthrobacter alpinus]